MSASPAPEAKATTTPIAPKPKGPSIAAPVKPANVFSNDGSFLERFKKSSAPPVDSDKQEREKALARKKAMEDRFKNRGKRTATPTSNDDNLSPESKKFKKTTTTGGSKGSDDPNRPQQNDDSSSQLTAYQREVQKLNARSLKDEGYEMRPLLK